MGKPLIPAQRRERIQEYLAVHQIARIADLCALLETSEATIRRDLEWLENEGLLERTHGGAILSQRLTSEPEYLARLQKNPDEKRLIGALAASLIEDGDIVFVDSGTTTTQVLLNIRANSNVTVFTNNVNASLELGDAGFSHHLLGGEYQPLSKSTAGRFALDNLRQVYADKAIIGVDGISLKHGCTVPTNTEAEVIRMMIERTKGQVIVAADHSKWGVVSNFQIASIDEVDVLVTNEKFSASAIEDLSLHSVKVMVASANPVKA